MGKNNKRFNAAAGVALASLLSVLVAGSAIAADSDHSANDKSTDKKTTKGSIRVVESTLIDAAPESVWSAVRDFDALSFWHPAVEGSNITKGENNKPGAQRHLTLKGGGTVDEQLISWDNSGMSYTYKIIGGVLPVAHYKSTISVQPEGEEKSRLVWQGRFDPAQGQSAKAARKAITNVYDAGLNNVDTMLAGD